MKNAFYFMLKALFVFKIFKYFDVNDCNLQIAKYIKK